LSQDFYEYECREIKAVEQKLNTLQGWIIVTLLTAALATAGSVLLLR